MVHNAAMRRFPLICLSVLVLAGCAGDNATPTEFIRVWGTGEADLVDGNATNARFSNPVNVEVASNGSVFVADFDNDAVRMIGTANQVSTLVKQANFGRPFGLTRFGETLYVQTDGNDLGARDSTTGTIWRVDTVAGGAEVVARNLGRPRGILTLADGRIVMSDIVQQTIRVLLNPTTGAVTLLAGSAGEAGFVNANGANARFSRPYGMALLSDGSILVADQNNNVLRRVTMSGDVSTFAGTGVEGVQNGPVASSTFDHPGDVTVAGSTVYVSDHDNHVIRKIAAGIVSTVAGNGNAGFVDSANNLLDEFFGMEGIAVTPDGSALWIADGNNGDGDPFNRVRRIRL
jgi:streptogramin lyase